MVDSHILEVLIASNDHRMISASTQAWGLVNNNVFVSFESLLTKESREDFLKHIDLADSSWFTIVFENKEEEPYIARVESDASAQNETPAIRVVLARLDELMEGQLQQNQLLATYDDMLSFHEDLYYEYLPDQDQIVLFNVQHTNFKQGSLSLDDFYERLKEECEPAYLSLLDDWVKHLRMGSSRFRINIPCNLINRNDDGVQAVIVHGVKAHHRDGRNNVIGMIHPLRDRTSDDVEVNYDALTGVLSREFIIKQATERIDLRKAERTALAIIDVDYFKHINDNYGHQRGDEVLKQVASLMQEEIGSAGLVGRIGGDEFMIMLYHVEDENELRAYLRSIKCVLAARQDKITVSIGAAVFPDDASNYNDLFMVSDFCLYLAKEKGRNRYIIHTPEKHPLVEQIREMRVNGERNFIRGRDDLPLGEAVVQLQHLVLYGDPPPIGALLSEFAERANIPILSLWRSDTRELIAAGGADLKDIDALTSYFKDHAPEELWTDRYNEHGMCVVNRVDKTEEGCLEIRIPLIECRVGSYIYVPLKDANGASVALIFAVVNRNIFWNQQHYMHYRLFADLITHYNLTASTPESQKLP
ncbi:MAG: GGDEF domain-containing protein [Clostridiales bacterium]|nr:GGDEF domain-containing protein [Clostridiales bacterium]